MGIVSPMSINLSEKFPPVGWFYIYIYIFFYNIIIKYQKVDKGKGGGAGNVDKDAFLSQ